MYLCAVLHVAVVCAAIIDWASDCSDQQDNLWGLTFSHPDAQLSTRSMSRVFCVYTRVQH